MSDIFREVQEDLQKDRYLALWRRYRWIILGIGALTVVSVAAWQVFSAWRQETRENLAQNFAQILKETDNEQNRDEVLRQLQGLALRKSGYQVLAPLTEAKIYWENDRKDKAVETWKNMQSADIQPVYQDLAALFAILAQLEATEASPQESLSSLADLAQSHRPFRALAMEVQALLALQQEQTERATDLLAKLSADTTIPDGLRERASRMLDHVSKPIASPASLSTEASAESSEPSLTSPETSTEPSSAPPPELLPESSSGPLSRTPLQTSTEPASSPPPEPRPESSSGPLSRTSPQTHRRSPRLRPLRGHDRSRLSHYHFGRRPSHTPQQILQISLRKSQYTS